MPNHTPTAPADSTVAAGAPPAFEHKNFEHKTFSAYSIKATDKKAGICECIVSVFNNVDRGRDRILPGFFAKSLRTKLPKGVWMHDWKKPVAKTLVAEEWLPGDPRLPDEIRGLGGLYIKGQFNLDTQRGREAFSDLDFGTVDEFSIGYQTIREKVDGKTGVRDLIEGSIYEWSPVLIGMNEATAMLSTKAGETGEAASGEVADATADDAPSGETPADSTLPAPESKCGYPDAMPMLAPMADGTYLGDTGKVMTAAALDRLIATLGYYLFSCVYSESPIDETLAHAGGAIDEFRGVALKLFASLLDEGKGDGEAASATSTSGFMSADLSTLISKHIDSYLAKLASFDTSGGRAVAALSLEARSKALVSDAGEIRDLGRKFLEVRTKEGRTLSSATRSRIRAVLEGITPLVADLEDLLASTEPAGGAKADAANVAMPADSPTPTSPPSADPRSLELRRRQFQLKSRLTLLSTDQETKQGDI